MMALLVTGQAYAAMAPRLGPPASRNAQFLARQDVVLLLVFCAVGLAASLLACAAQPGFLLAFSAACSI